jgi:membrane protease subunit HflK
MPWNSQGGGGGPWGGGSGGGGGNGPWGRGTGGGGGGGRPGGPNQPDFEEMLRRGQDRVRRMLPGGIGGSRAVILIIFVALAVWLASGIYRVDADEKGVNLVFGRFVGTTEPGINYNFPAPIGQVFTPKVTRQNRVEIGFVTGATGARQPQTSESLMLTGDENIIDIQFVGIWQIRDAEKYLFEIRSPDETVKNAAEATMREIIGKTDLNYALTEGRAELESETQELLQRILDSYNSGIAVNQVQLQKVDPPEQVIASFRDVQAARADNERVKNEAQRYANDIVPRARGEAAQIIEDAEAYKAQVVNRANGDAERFISVYNQYSKAEEVTKERIYLETLEEVLKNVNKIVVDKDAGQGVVPYLPLPEVEKRRSGASDNGPGAGDAGTTGQGGTR